MTRQLLHKGNSRHPPLSPPSQLGVRDPAYGQKGTVRRLAQGASTTTDRGLKGGPAG